eukprot:4785611-Prymnesium_polylepis.1
MSSDMSSNAFVGVAGGVGDDQARGVEPNRLVVRQHLHALRRRASEGARRVRVRRPPGAGREGACVAAAERERGAGKAAGAGSA